MRTDGFWPPPIVTSPTPLSCEIFGASRESARSSTLESAMVFDVRASVKTGASDGFDLLYTGGTGRSVGKKLCAALMAACTSCSATSIFRRNENCKTIDELPSELVEVICVRPGICPNCLSSGAVTADDITSGLAPG